jgi:eukaryotic-like serine/threonine-protein kinase
MMDKFGKYEVVRQLASGGFGSVYEARDPVIQRAVAIKTCHVSDPEVRERFIQEARLAGNLHHRNLTTIYDIGSEGSVLYLVCEFLPGEDLDKLVEHRDLALLDKVEILIGIAYGLGYAHNAGVIHRDIKPGNIRILPDATVKIMDFGIAKSMHAERTLTRAGETLGTAFYLSPEQVRGEPIDRRTDIFSFGVVAYELISSKRPFSGSSAAAILDAIVRHEPPSLQDVCGVTPDLSQLVGRAVQKKPEDRYSSMDAVRQNLISIRRKLLSPDVIARAEEPAPATTAVRAPKARRPIFWIALLAALTITAAVLWLLTHGAR